MGIAFSGASRPNLFPDIWAALSVERLVGLLPELHPHPRGRHLLLTCPGCGKPEAYVYESQDGRGPHIHCNRKNNCGHDQSVWEYVKAQHGGDTKAAFAALAGSAGIGLETPPAGFAALKRQVTRQNGKTRFTGLPRASEALLQIPEGLEEKQKQYGAALAGSPAEDFLRQRGLSLDTAARMGFGFCASWPHEGRPRLTYPLTDRAGRITALEGRLLPVGASVGHGRLPKCLCDGPKGAGVFAPKPLCLDGLYLCEGPFDAACLAGFGLDAVAVCGTAVPEWLIKACAFRTVWLAFDADEAGDKAAETVTAALAKRGALAQRLRPIPEGSDWGDALALSRSLLRERVWTAQGVPEPLKHLRREYTKLVAQVEYLQTHERTATHDRAALWARVGEGITAFAWLCDLPDGYSDPDDPFAKEALLTLRHWADGAAAEGAEKADGVGTSPGSFLATPSEAEGVKSSDKRLKLQS